MCIRDSRKYRYIETNAAKDTLTKFGKGDKTPDPYTPEQVKALMQRVEGTVWEMPVILGGLYGMRRSEILGLRQFCIACWEAWSQAYAYYADGRLF